MNDVEITINLLELIAECNYELDLIPYYINMKLIENNIPSYINYIDVLSNHINVKMGILEIIDQGISIKIKWKL